MLIVENFERNICVSFTNKMYCSFSAASSVNTTLHETTVHLNFEKNLTFLILVIIYYNLI